MQVALSTARLDTAVKHAAKGITSRATLPVLSGVVITAEGEEATVYGSDLETWQVSTLPAFVDQPGSVVLPGKQLATILKKSRGEVVRIKADGHEATIIVGKTEYRVSTMSADDYPDLPYMGGATIPLGRSDLVDGIARVLPAVSRDQSRSSLASMRLTARSQPAGVALVGTDSYRLAVAELEPAGPVPTTAVNLPRDGAKAALAVLKASREECVEVILASDVTWFRVGTTWTGVRNTDCDYPNYRQLIPDTLPTRANLPTAETLEVLERVAVMAQHNLPVRITLNGSVELSAHTPDVGEACEDVDGASWKGDGLGLMVSFNPKFLADGIKACGGDTVTMQVRDQLRPAVFRNDDGSFCYVLMPVRTS